MTAADATRALADLLRPAYLQGVEVSIAELADRLGLGDESHLVVVEQVSQIVGELGLDLVPGIGEGGLETRRILRDSDIAIDTSEFLRETISSGEGQTVEFKASMHCDLNRLAATGEMHAFSAGPNEVLKTICAFLNSSGGTLLVGIQDSGDTSSGIERDLEVRGSWTLDDWQLDFWSLIESRFYLGRQIRPYVRAEMVSCDGESVFLVRVVPRSDPSFVKFDSGDFKFFVRSGPRTNSLSMPEFYEYMFARNVPEA